MWYIKWLQQWGIGWDVIHVKMDVMHVHKLRDNVLYWILFEYNNVFTISVRLII